MTGYSFSTPVWDGSTWVTPVVAEVRAAPKANGPEDQPPRQDAPAPAEWDQIDWREQEGQVRRLRQRIFTAAQEQDWAKVRNLQKLMVRHEALLFRMEVEDLDLPAVVAVGVKLEEAWAGGRRRGREQPRQSRVGSVLPDGPGAVSETGRYTRGTGCVTPLHSAPALTRWMRAGLRCAPARAMTGRGTPGRGLISSGQEVTVKVYGVADDDAAGAEPGA